MSTKIEQLIDDIEDYINSCKFKAFSTSEIIVNKDEIDSLLNELRKKTPEEIKRYQKIISNKEAILEDARVKAKALIDEATAQTTELVNEHEIMLQAYKMADEVVVIASSQAQEIVDNATIEANELKSSALRYTDDLLANVENIVTHYLEAYTSRANDLIGSLNECYEVVRGNREELMKSATAAQGIEELIDEDGKEYPNPAPAEKKDKEDDISLDLI